MLCKSERLRLNPSASPFSSRAKGLIEKMNSSVSMCFPVFTQLRSIKASFLYFSQLHGVCRIVEGMNKEEDSLSVTLFLPLQWSEVCVEVKDNVYWVRSFWQGEQRQMFYFLFLRGKKGQEMLLLLFYNHVQLVLVHMLNRFHLLFLNDNLVKKKSWGWCLRYYLDLSLGVSPGRQGHSRWLID